MPDIIIDQSAQNIMLPQFKTYIAKLTQTGTDAPVADVYVNTIGDIVWTRDGVGTYQGTSSGLFVAGKTVIPPFGGDLGVYLPIFFNTPADNFYNICPNGSGSDIVNITWIDASGANVEWSGLNTAIVINIIVYP